MVVVRDDKWIYHRGNPPWKWPSQEQKLSSNHQFSGDMFFFWWGGGECHPFGVGITPFTSRQELYGTRGLAILPSKAGRIGTATRRKAGAGRKIQLHWGTGGRVFGANRNGKKTSIFVFLDVFARWLLDPVNLRWIIYNYCRCFVQLGIWGDYGDQIRCCWWNPRRFEYVRCQR